MAVLAGPTCGCCGSAALGFLGFFVVPVSPNNADKGERCRVCCCSEWLAEMMGWTCSSWLLLLGSWLGLLGQVLGSGLPDESQDGFQSGLEGVAEDEGQAIVLLA